MAVGVVDQRHKRQICPKEDVSYQTYAEVRRQAARRHWLFSLLADDMGSEETAREKVTINRDVRGKVCANTARVCDVTKLNK